MRTPWTAHNTPCLACGEYKPEFVRFGALPFCEFCFDTIFHKNLIINEEKDRYSWWLKIYLHEEWTGKNNMRRFKDEYDYKYADTPKTIGDCQCGEGCSC